MRISYLVNTYPRPSHSFVRREIGALERQGHEIVRLAMRPPPDPLSEPEDIAETARTHYVLGRGAAMRLTGAVLRQALRAPAAALAALVLAVRAGRLSDRGVLIHLVYFAQAAYVAATCRARSIEHLHAHFGTNPATVAMLARAMGGPTYSFTVHGPEEFDRPVALMLGEKVHRAAFIVAISAYGRSQLCRWAAHEDWPRIQVVHCGIDPAALDSPAPPPRGGPHLVAIGRFAEQKGHLVLIDAMQRLGSLCNLHLTLVGDGEMRPRIEAAIRKAGLEGRVTLAGWQAEAGVRKALSNAHALILPSFAEGLPVVAMEAMAAGRPVISTWIAGIPELVTEGETGWLVPAGDAQALADAVKTLAAQDTVTLARMGAAARTRVLDRHNVDNEARKLAAHFASAIVADRPECASAAGRAIPDPAS